MSKIDPPSPRLARGRERVGRALDGVFLYGVILVALVPVAYLLVSSFNAGDLGAPFQLSAAAWKSVFSNPAVYRAILNSLILSLRVIPGLVIALAIAWSIVRLNLPGRRFIEVSFWFAFFLPTVPIAAAWILLLHKDYGLINTFLSAIPFFPRGLFSIHSIGGLVWIHLTINTVPFLVLLFTPVVRQFDAAYEEAALIGGASHLQALVRVVWPMLLPAILAAIIAAYIKGLASFEIEQLVGTPAGILIYSTEIFALLRQDPPLVSQAMALGSIMLVVVLILGGLQLVASRLWPPRATIRSQGARSGRSIRPRARTAAGVLVILYILISIYLPVGIVVLGSFNKIFGLFAMANPWTTRHWVDVFSDDGFYRALRNSALLGLAVALIALPAYFRLAWITARKPIGGANAAALLLWLPWALPGFVVGLSLLDIMLRVDLFAGAYGTLIPVLLVLFLKELPLAVHFIRGGLGQIGTELEEAAALAGGGRLTVLRRITLPLLSSTMISVFILVFVSAIQEISSIVLVASPGTETVSLLMFDYARAGKYESAAVIGVVYAAAAMVLAFFVNRRLVPVDPR